MADVTIKYKGSTIAEMSGTDTKTIETAGQYCEDNIIVSSNGYETGFLSLSVIDVTIGANTVANGSEAYIYLNELVNGCLCAASLLENPDTRNQLVLVQGAMDIPRYAETAAYRAMKPGYRYRDGDSGQFPLYQDFGWILKEGSRYRLWVTNSKVDNLAPY